MPPDLGSAAAGDALAALGKLRECAAAARNLEQLAGARSVGPKVLSQIGFDVATALSEFEPSVRFLSGILAEGRSGAHPAFAQLAQLGRSPVEALISSLHGLDRGPVNAKRRLELERQLTQTLPPLYSAVSHWEMLVESYQAEAVTMSLEELLSSRPEREIERSMVAVDFGGDLSLSVAVPPRVGLATLGAWVSLAHGERTCPGVVAAVGEGEVVLRRCAPEGVSQRVQLPVFHPTASTAACIDAALRPHDGRVQGDALVFSQGP